MEADISKRGLGELIDEYATLTFKVIANVGGSKTFDRLEELNTYLIKKIDHKLMYTLLLFSTNAACWAAQEIICDKSQSNEDIAKAATYAQQLNRMRNQIIGSLNDGKGIVTEKSY